MKDVDVSGNRRFALRQWKGSYRSSIFFWAAGCSLLVLCFLVAMPFRPASAEGQYKAPGTLTFTNSYGPVSFDHKTHRRFSCSKCHPPFDYKFNDNKSYSVKAHKTCNVCHYWSGMSTDCISCHNIYESDNYQF